MLTSAQHRTIQLHLIYQQGLKLDSSYRFGATPWSVVSLKLESMGMAGKTVSEMAGRVMSNANVQSVLDQIEQFPQADRLLLKQRLAELAEAESEHEARPFDFDVAKAIQAIGVLLRSLDRRRLEYLSLLTMLYIADRESLKDRGRPIIGDQAVAMKHGPVLSGVYDLIHFNRPKDLSLWARFFTRDEYDLALNEMPATDRLSRYEIRKLEEIAQRHAQLGWREIVRITHDLPEWQKNDPEKFAARVMPIPLNDILEAVGRRPEEMKEIFDDAEAVTACRHVLGG